MFEEIVSRLSEVKIVPVVTVFDKDEAVKLAHSLVNRGYSAVEFAFRSATGAESDFIKAGECIQAVRKLCPKMLCGAGTVINPKLAELAKNSGAQFVMSPGFNPATVEWCIKNDMAIFPGVNSPSQVEEALMYGIDVLKFFPAEISGGVKMLKALGGPFPTVKFIPTGGIDAANADDYLACKNVIAVGGSWVCQIR
ncbi:bifunctional 4-hydroxy-2-oxoglutarate aldolase/2-dehydro-3-deoxy-phosphogluconate aldolase [Treponema sp. C6A8]|uniref:bifunctional 4-hydroxy-2-oxoglutarate aldolase/2-dehydro-3-deoxy-phosphogluconate aldolase n=1 Tax=Treponema sp. C6A8 TaxID=1410609 RepID=UPI000484E745|nr:bifunctional 4-hydroxy-2-oxoglutarate aldolase/2-dehydro-3-deoxy-phosphogluconate aldolase [Treponema sp. C6A8]